MTCGVFLVEHRVREPIYGTSSRSVRAYDGCIDRDERRIMRGDGIAQHSEYCIVVMLQLEMDTERNTFRAPYSLGGYHATTDSCSQES